MAKPLNPFQFGNPVEGDYYLPRPALARTVSQFLDNRVPVVLIGPRRFGKTSFVLNLLRDMEAAGSPCIFVDIFNVTSHRDFLQQLLRALKTKRGWGEKLKDGFARLRPQFTVKVDPDTGAPEFSFGIDTAGERDIKEAIQDVLSGLSAMGDGLVFAIDEFQKIAELEDGGWLEATLRSKQQELKNTSFLFTGSRKSVINDMMNNVSRPFYRSCQPIDFPALGSDFTAWIIQRFKTVGIACSAPVIDYLRECVQQTPNYVQMACFHLTAEGVENVTKTQIDSVLKTIVRQNSYAYQTLLNSLTPIQQRTLRLSAIEASQVYSKDILARYEITTSAALASSLKALKGKQIVDEETARGKVIFDDPLFAIWLRAEFKKE